MSGPIVLLTDFGLQDAYVGIMKGVILRINPSATIVDLCHAVAPQDVAEGALLLADSYRFFPADAIFVGVVDPGVGSARRAIALETPHGRFVGPDNGLFSGVVADFGVRLPALAGAAALQGSAVHGVALESRQFFLPQVSATFHGRDVFAPVAANLSLGVPFSALGPPLVDLVVLPTPKTELQSGLLRGQVIHLDHFGNAITNLEAADLASFRAPVVEVAGQQIVGLSQHYAERPGLLAHVDSSGRLEIALNGGNAAQVLGIRVGEPVTVREARE
jgi:S-adenosylmethionine hydrolase